MAGLDTVLETTTAERPATGFVFTEGPLWHPDGFYYFADVRSSVFYRLRLGQAPETVRTGTGEGNGTTFDLQGRLVICEGGNRRVTRWSDDQHSEVLMDRYEGKRINRPNDVVCKSDGSIWFTDPGLRVPLADKELPHSGIYAVNPDGTSRLVAEFEYPNGLAFSPDERILYVANTRHAQYIHAIDLDSAGNMVKRRIFADMSSEETDGVPDGMKVDQQGHLYCTGPGGTWVFAPDGSKLGVIRTPEIPANLAFGGPDLKTIFFTARNSVYTLRAKVPGQPHPWYPCAREITPRRAIMKVGIALNMLSEPGRTDVAVVSDHLAMGDLAEPLGFDSLFALEHHFTGYAMSPAPLQLLAYFAGRTQRIMFGTSVIVLPWHDPIRVAEEIALLDILCGGRCLFGFGRGAASVEYAGFRIPMGEARPRFAEAAQLIRKALREPEFEWQGEFYQIPRTSIRPRPISHPEERFFASSVSPESAEIMAKLGFGILVVMQNEWPKAAENIVSYREIALSVGHNPPPPIILTNVSCAESRDEAQDRAMQWLGKKWQSIDDHYHFSDGHLATVKGYETYGKMAKTYARLQDEEERVRATEFYVKIQIVGTPEDCTQQIAELQRVTGTDHVVTEFSFGGIPHADAEKNMRLFASRVLPVLQHDNAFATPPAPAMTPQGPTKTDVFAPA